MKKILLITETLGSGGAERQICGLASMLTKAGFPCRLITYVENQFYEPYLRQNGVDYQFVLKTTHGGGGGGVVICKDKQTFNRADAIAKLNQSMRSDIYRGLREWPYK